MPVDSSGGKVRPGCLAGGFLALVALGVGGYFLTERLVSDKVEALVRDNAVLARHIGELRTLELDRSATREAERQHELVFRVEGTRGRGLLRVEFASGAESLARAALELPSGEVHDLLERPGDG